MNRIILATIILAAASCGKNTVNKCGCERPPPYIEQPVYPPCEQPAPPLYPPEGAG